MSWFFIALIPPILYAVTNHIDKFLVSKYLKGNAIGSLIIFSAIFSIIALPVILAVHPSVFDVGFLKSTILVINGMLIIVAVLCYLYALNIDEVSNVMPLIQLIPIFGFIFSFLILGETITKIQFIGSIIILMGITILSLDIGSKITFKKRVIILMVITAILYAISDVIFKMIALDDGFWPATFWSMIGRVIIGISFFIFIKNFRDQFIELIRNNKLKVLALNSLNETLFIIAELVGMFAILLAPIVLVMLVNSFQPMFVFIISILLTIFLPNICRECLDKQRIVQKTIGIGLIVIGTLFLG